MLLNFIDFNGSIIGAPCVVCTDTREANFDITAFNFLGTEHTAYTYDVYVGF